MKSVAQNLTYRSGTQQQNYCLTWAESQCENWQCDETVWSCLQTSLQQTVCFTFDTYAHQREYHATVHTCTRPFCLHSVAVRTCVMSLDAQWHFVSFNRWFLQFCFSFILCYCFARVSIGSLVWCLVRSYKTSIRSIECIKSTKHLQQSTIRCTNYISLNNSAAKPKNLLVSKS